MPRFALVLCGLVAASSCWTSAVCAQAPTLNPPFPMGVQRGVKLDLLLTGANLHDPTAVVASFPVAASFPPENNNGKDPAKLTVRLDVPADAPLGWHTLRLVTKRGLSNFRLFCVDDLPQVLKAGAPNAPDQAQPIPIPCVLCGTMEREKTDYYKLTVQAGQRVSFEMFGRRLGSPLDPQIALLHPQTQRQLAFADDSPGQSKDPRLTYVFKESGAVLLEVRDVRYQGGQDWRYRIRIGDFPLASVPVPLAAKRGTSTVVRFAGPLVDLNQAVSVNAPADPNLEAISIWPRSNPVFPEQPNGLPGWPVALRLTDLPELTESEASASPAQAQLVPIPGAVSGRFLKPGEKDHYRLALKQGQRVLVKGLAHEAGSPTTLYLTLLDAAGKQLAASEPAQEPARIDFTAPAEGAYSIAAEHLHYNGGPDEAYRIEVRPYEPSFQVNASADRLTLWQGAAAVLTVTAQREGFDGPIDVAVQHPPGVAGQTTIPAGRTQGLLVLSAAAQAALRTEPLRLVGTAAINGKPVSQPVTIEPLVKQALGNLPYPPLRLSKEMAVSVLPAAPFTFKAAYVHPEGVRGLSVPVQLTVEKKAGFDEEVTFGTLSLPPAPNQPPPLPPLAAKLPKGQTTLRGELKPAAATPDGTALAATATASANGIAYVLAVPLPPLKLTLPHELTVEAPAEVRLPTPKADPAGAALLDGLGAGPGFLRLLEEASAKAAKPPTVKVKAVRKGGYTGPILVELKNLPAGVTAVPTAIPDQQSEIAIPLAIAANAAVGKKADVIAEGKALGAGNQQANSPPFTLNVAK